VALAVAGPLAEALMIPAETLAAGVPAAGAAAAVERSPVRKTHRSVLIIFIESAVLFMADKV
jgi:hypothetical protein